MRLANFCGGSCPEASVNAAAERSRNVYPHIISGGAPPNNPILYKIPGLRLVVAPGGSSTRGNIEINGRSFFVAGETVYELLADDTAVSLGTVVEDDNPAVFASNGTAGDQVMLTSGGEGYIIDLAAGTLTQITDPDFPSGFAKMCGFVDGYFVVLRSDSGIFQISEIPEIDGVPVPDGLLWDELDIAQVSTASDKVVSMICHNRQIYLFGGATTTVWYNAGAPDFPFAPVNSVMQQGIVAPFTACRADNTVFWLGKNEHGAGVFFREQQGTPQRVSTHAMEQIWASYDTLTNAETYVEQWNGHVFIHLWIPSAEDATDNDNAVSWVYDVASNMWHERALWNSETAQWAPMIGRCHMHAFEKHLIGDRRTGALYEQRADLYSFSLVTV